MSCFRNGTPHTHDTMVMNMVANDVVFAYRSVPVLNSVSLQLNPSEIVGIIGPNGSGKTTMLKCLNRILAPTQGDIMIHDQDASQMKRLDIAKLVGYVPQHSHSHGNHNSPHVFEVVLMGRRPHATWQSSKADEQKVWDILTSLNIDKLASHHFDELSGGQRQKVLIARALAQEAKILLLDEPTSSLDIKHQMEVMDLLRELARSQGVSVCAIVHDLDLAMKYCDKVIMMNDGKIFSAGDSSEVITAQNIKEVYHVDAVINESHGRPHVMVI